MARGAEHHIESSMPVPVPAYLSVCVCVHLWNWLLAAGHSLEVALWRGRGATGARGKDLTSGSLSSEQS